MKPSITAALLVLAALSPLAAQAAPSAAELLARVDDNEVYASISYSGRMSIEYQGRRYVKTMRAFARGRTESFVEFTNPEDSGTKYLKKDGRLFVYSPDTEEVMPISGHLLKESMMGSDLSYEDTVDNEPLSVRYEASLAGTEALDGRTAWVLDLVARKKTESYPRQRLWIDTASGELLRYELYALSGSRLKEYRLIRSRTLGGRLFPVEFEMRDLLRKGSRTLFAMDEISLDVAIPDDTFSLRNLER